MSTSWTQEAGMTGDPDVDNVQDLAEDAAASKDAAATSATAAATSATAAADSATAAAASESSVAANASQASTSASNAATSATSAQTAQTAAETAETNAEIAQTAAEAAQAAAETAETNAETAQTAAETAQSAAETAQAGAEAVLEAINGSYLGVQTSDPTLDLNGEAITKGDWYYNENTDVTRIYDGSAWVNGAVDTSSFLLSGNNLSDLGNAATARTNLGLGTAATTSSTDYATAAQGALADSALQSFTETNDLTSAVTWANVPDANITQTSVTQHQAALSITESQISDFGSYLTSYTETDPVYTASSWYTTTNNASNWDTAYGWGDHSTEGYLTSIPDNYVLNTGDSITGDLSFGDNDKAIFGASSDLQIFHNGTNNKSVIDCGPVNPLDIYSNAFSVKAGLGGVYTMLTADVSGSVDLYYADVKKFETTAQGVSVTGRATGTVTTDNDLSFDMSATNNFSCTPTGTGTLTFTNITSGQSGNIYLDNSGGHVISAAATTFISAADLTKISTAGKYFVSYYSADGTNVLVSASSAVTASGA
jgi:hypothetical protein